MFKIVALVPFQPVDFLLPPPLNRPLDFDTTEENSGLNQSFTSGLRHGFGGLVFGSSFDAPSLQDSRETDLELVIHRRPGLQKHRSASDSALEPFGNSYLSRLLNGRPKTAPGDLGPDLEPSARPKRPRSSQKRHEMTDQRPYMVQTGLFVSCIGGSQNIDTLRDLNIRHIVRIGDRDKVASLSRSTPTGLESYPFSFSDQPTTFILKFIKDIAETLTPHIVNQEAVLVHCQVGKSRSAAVTMGVLLHLFFSGQMATLPQFIDLHAALKGSEDPVLTLFQQMTTTRLANDKTSEPDSMAPSPSFMAQLYLIQYQYSPMPDGMSIQDSFIKRLLQWCRFYRDPNSGINLDHTEDYIRSLQCYPLGIDPTSGTRTDEQKAEAFFEDLTKRNDLR
jgi:hypothetical protein